MKGYRCLYQPCHCITILLWLLTVNVTAATFCSVGSNCITKDTFCFCCAILLLIIADLFSDRGRDSSQRTNKPKDGRETIVNGGETYCDTKWMVGLKDVTDWDDDLIIMKKMNIRIHILEIVEQSPITTRKTLSEE